ncbi:MULTISPECIES: hypothetical protein [unclassified Actinobaculum]|uniref:hypothetical protein n=1 Tax=unclassified Actinobaculum TaxID=2609299 RepID=UPI000D5284E7|nr:MULTISPECIES: hypothetical protein [unclassified Actinobaculum]AWE42766.1 hypothetical protein DDD63_08440 [Actinobaculum sp. 313]RTE49579.1 hypothetical protein EKN07_05905 [Actinobaculum sp. 352]
MRMLMAMQVLTAAATRGEEDVPSAGEGLMYNILRFDFWIAGIAITAIVIVCVVHLIRNRNTPEANSAEPPVYPSDKESSESAFLAAPTAPSAQGDHESRRTP